MYAEAPPLVRISVPLTLDVTPPLSRQICYVYQGRRLVLPSEIRSSRFAWKPGVPGCLVGDQLTASLRRRHRALPIGTVGN